MRNVLFLIIPFLLFATFSCNEDDDSPECKECMIIVETMDSLGNIISSTERDHQTLCESELYEAESQNPVIIDNRKSYWSCK